tara:strand:- start:10029 stop:10382 length:354 start_codon:yes stop_codon:yes gene_type:complete
MTITVSEALDSDTAIIVTVERQSGGYIDGLWVDGTPTIFKTLCSPQPASAKERQILPEGDRDKDIFKFITKKPLRGVSDRDELSADIVIFKGNRYTILSPADWDLYGHTTSLGARVQ